MKVNKYFDLKELVPEEIYKEFGEDSIKFLDKDAIKLLEEIREILNVPLTCNNWHLGGSRNYSGFRQKDCPVGVKNSQHKSGNAFDLISNKLTAEEMRDKIDKNKDKLSEKIRVEKWNKKDEETSWFHFDLKENKSLDKVYFFKA